MAMMKKWPTGAIPRLSDVMDDDIKGFSRDTEPLFLGSLDPILVFEVLYARVHEKSGASKSPKS